MVSNTENRRTEYDWTPRQKEVLALLARGRSNAEIAELLGISPAGVKWHVGEILSKLQVETREDASEYWRRENGLPLRLYRSFTRGWAPFAVKLGAASVGVAALGYGSWVLAASLGSANSTPTESTPAAPSPQVTSPVSSPTQLAPTATPSASPGNTVTTGLPTVDAVIQAVLEVDQVRVKALLQPSLRACDGDDLSPAPSCRGAAPGTMVPAIYAAQCEFGWVNVAEFSEASVIVDADYQIRVVVAGGPDVGSPPAVVGHWAVFDIRTPNLPGLLAVAIGTEGVLGLRLSCGSPDSLIAEIVPFGRNVYPR